MGEVSLQRFSGVAGGFSLFRSPSQPLGLGIKSDLICTTIFETMRFMAFAIFYKSRKRENGKSFWDNLYRKRSRRWHPSDVLLLRTCADYCAPCQPLLRAFLDGFDLHLLH